MRKIILSPFVVLCLLSATLFAWAAPPSLDTNCTILVEDEVLDAEELPVSAYMEDGEWMVPLRSISEALGYDVAWLSETQEIRVEDSVQRAILHEGSKTAEIQGKLKIINLSQELQFNVEVAVHRGRAYVPVSFFEHFFNDVSIDGTQITICAQKSELCQ